MVFEAFEVVTVPFNSDGWGPPDASDTSSTSVAAANLLPNVPLASFSRAEKLGRVADWTRSLSNPSARPPTGSKSDSSSIFDFSAFAVDEGFGLTNPSGNPDEDAAFRLVDGKPPPRPRFGPKWRFNNFHNRNQLPQRRDEEVEAKKREAEKDRARRDRLYNNNRNNLHHQRREAAAFKSSVDIQPEWNMLEQIPFSSFSKLSFTVQEPEDLLLCGGLESYDRSFDRITPKNERRLERFKNRSFKVTTSDDDVIRRLAKEDKATVFATDAILAALMCAPRSVYSWDLVIQRVGNKLFFDKRDGSPLDLLSVHETSQEPLPEGKDDINSAHSLGLEAAFINQNFAQQVLVKNGKREAFEEPIPNVSEGEENASVAYRYRRWKLDESMYLVARCELQSTVDLNNQKSFLTLNALNEFDPKYSGVDWRQKLETQRGAVLANELKNNGNKLAKWTAQALLANADMMKIGFVSRVHPRDHFNHVILSVLGYKPKDFAGQINLNTLNMWGIVKSIVDLCMKLSEGKYVLVKDPSKPQVRIYEVPADAFENDYVEEPLPEDEQVQPPEESTEGGAEADGDAADKKPEGQA
ncbi:Eukaryotic translation initiation factor 3 subunit 7 [Hirschfeldia incana]|nr:Eukaryotic translation initiation factor 3 subunit 7 [Hirschfeldia incana]